MQTRMFPDHRIGEGIDSAQRLLSSGRDDRADFMIACAIAPSMMEAGSLSAYHLDSGEPSKTDEGCFNPPAMMWGIGNLCSQRPRDVQRDRASPAAPVPPMIPLPASHASLLLSHHQRRGRDRSSSPLCQQEHHQEALVAD